MVFGGMGTIGVVSGLFAAITTTLLFAYQGTETSAVLGMFGVFTLLTLVPAIALRWTRNRRWYAFATGMAACWLVLTACTLPPMLEGPGMSSEQIDRATQRINSSGTVAYDVGRVAEGHDLDEVYRDGEYGASGVSVGYGNYCEGGDLGCSSHIYVRTLSISSQYLFVYGCQRREPVAGVPAATRGTDETLILFTGASMVSLETDESASALDSELAMAAELRRLGEDDPLSSLPPPKPSVLALVDKECGTVS
jgi:hypothetical protein